jgi:Tol biopolymer transport system component
VIDGVEGKWYDSIGPVVFSKNGGRMAYAAHEKNNSIIVLDGKEESKFPNLTLDNLAFSPDGSRFAFSASSFGGNAFVISDNKRGKQYHSVDGIVFNPDSKHLVYTANMANTNKYCVVVDEKETGSYDMVWPPVFGMNTDRMIYKIRNDDKYHVVIDGKIGKGYDFIWVGTPVFTPDGNHIIYVAREGDKIFLVLDENESERKFGGISTIGGRITFDSTDKFHYIARRQGDIYLVRESIGSAD